MPHSVEMPPALPDAAPVPGRRPVLLGLVGTPSAMTHWGIHLVRVIAGVVGGGHGLVHGNFLGEFAALAGLDPAVPSDAIVLCTSDCPEVALCRRLLAEPLVVLAEDPADVIDDLMAGGVDAVDALRLAVRSTCALEPLLAAPGVTVFGRRNFDDTMADFVDALLATLRIQPTAEQRRSIDRQVADFGPTGSVRDHLGHLFPVVAARSSEPAPGAASSAERPAAHPLTGAMAGSADLLAGTLPAIDAAGARAVALPYGAITGGRPLDEVEWPTAIFSRGDAPGEYVAGPCDMIGRARIMIYGPYMHLPSGDWSARVEMEVTGNISGNRLKVDLVCGPRVLVAASADMPIFGQYAFTLDFDTDEPLDPIELRFQIESGAIEGHFLLRRVVMTRRTEGGRSGAI